MNRIRVIFRVRIRVRFSVRIMVRFTYTVSFSVRVRGSVILC